MTDERLKLWEAIHAAADALNMARTEIAIALAQLGSGRAVATGEQLARRAREATAAYSKHDRERDTAILALREYDAQQGAK